MADKESTNGVLETKPAGCEGEGDLVVIGIAKVAIRPTQDKSGAEARSSRKE